MPRPSGRGGTADALSTMTVLSGMTGRVRTAYRCRAYPTPEQAVVLNRTFGLYAWSGIALSPPVMLVTALRADRPRTRRRIGR
ncbi:helix-turn-helix domain-containing protein [Micromonospora sp. NPDC002717]|uniref:helix-turn-helix domain-containing protein n=1 Tax=Micromonospora sp. NPDC002717 TaxID=3154424 RepID=UPI00331F5A0A